MIAIDDAIAITMVGETVCRASDFMLGTRLFNRAKAPSCICSAEEIEKRSTRSHGGETI